MCPRRSSVSHHECSRLLRPLHGDFGRLYKKSSGLPEVVHYEKFSILVLHEEGSDRQYVWLLRVLQLGPFRLPVCSDENPDTLAMGGCSLPLALVTSSGIMSHPQNIYISARTNGKGSRGRVVFEHTPLAGSPRTRVYVIYSPNPALYHRMVDNPS